MPGYLRERSDSFGDYVGYLYPIGSPPDSQPVTVSTGSVHCKDVVGNFDGVNVFELERWRLNPGRISGQEAVWPVYGLNEYPYQNQPSPDFASADWSAGMLGDVEAVTKVAAWTNPTRNHVDITTMVYELRDLPGLLLEWWELTAGIIRGTVRHSRKGQPVSNEALGINWGVAPLISDLIKLFQFTKAFDKRVRDMKAIYDRPHGLSRQRVLWAYTTERTDYVAANSFICGVGVDRRYRTTARQWASVTWKPWFDFQTRPSDEEIANKAIAALTGIKNPLAMAWEILPWSWLIDYFANVGDLIELTGNAFEYKIDQSCVMTSVTTTISDKVVVQHPDFTVQPAYGKWELKFRTPVSIGFAVNSSVISTQQLVNLASVASNWKR